MQCLLANKLILRTYRDRISCTAYPSVGTALTKECVDWQSRFLCLLANATVLLPSPSLMIAASCALILNPLAVAFTAALGSSAGELVGYLFGNTGRDLSPRFRACLAALGRRIHRPEILVFVLALLPLPLFDVAGIYSGGSGMPLRRFFLLCFAGKFLKMLVYTRVYDILAWAEAAL